jgi:hypothetical protein
MTEAVPTLIDETNHVVTLKPVVTLQNDPTADLVDVPVISYKMLLPLNWLLTTTVGMMTFRKRFLIPKWQIILLS